MNEEKRRFTRTDRPGSGVYRGAPSPAVAFDDYRAADEHEIHRRRDRPGAWRRLLAYLRSGLFPLANDQVVAKAKAALARDPSIDTSRIAISADESNLRVSGSVPSRWMKERISDCLLEMSGVSSIRNDLQVRAEHPRLPQEESLSI